MDGAEDNRGEERDERQQKHAEACGCLRRVLAFAGLLTGRHGARVAVACSALVGVPSAHMASSDIEFKVKPHSHPGIIAIALLGLALGGGSMACPPVPAPAKVEPVADKPLAVEPPAPLMPAASIAAPVAPVAVDAAPVAPALPAADAAKVEPCCWCCSR